MKDTHCRNTTGNRGIGSGSNPGVTNSSTKYKVGVKLGGKVNKKGVVSQGKGKKNSSKKMSY